MPLAHSYSSIKSFENCPKQYHEVRILKKFKQEDTQATLYGTAVHEALEFFLTANKEIPPQFAQFQRFAEPVKKLWGEMKCEYKMGIKADFSPCEFFAPDVWFRGIPDVLVVNHRTGVARVVDWKTGKSSKYADTAQLELLAGMVFSHYPNVKKVKGALVFLVADAVVQADFTREQYAEIMSKWAGKASMIESSLESGVWNARPSPLCGWCPVQDCAHHRSR
jgi:RecB family exonuclease